MPKPSQFTISTTHEPSGDLLLFNTSSGAVAAFPSDLSDDVGLAMRSAAGANPEVIDALSTAGFLVDEDRDEVGEVMRRLAMGISDPNRLDLFILPNMKCNFGCPYCYENHHASRLSDAVRDRILAWVERMVPQFKLVLVSWFGGEPMLSHDRVIEMQQRIVEICRANDVEIAAHITTNGYLLTSDRAAELMSVGVHSYQVTMDGPPRIHNVGRQLKGGGASFDAVFGNLCALAEQQPDAHIKLRVNFDHETIGHVPELLQMFPDHVRSRLNLVLEPIFGQAPLDKKPIRGVAQAAERVYGIARELGFNTPTAQLKPTQLTYCYADRASEFVFNHVGDVFKCTVGNFTAKERLGALDDDGRVIWDGAEYDDWMAIPAVDDACRKCTYLPMCMGGCRKTRKYTGRSSADCTMPFEALDVRVQQRYTETLASQ